MESSPWGNKPTQYFYELTPEKILDAVEKALDVRCTGRAFAHNSMENRVYELEIEIDDNLVKSVYDRQRIVKFYRPGRWSREQILEEHQFLLALLDNDIPVVAPMALKGDQTLLELPDLGLYFAVFPKVGGRSPFELDNEQIDRIGRLLARMHNVGAAMKSSHRVHITPQTYGLNNLKSLQDGGHLPAELSSVYSDLVREVCALSEPLFKDLENVQLHGDCHLGNLLWSADGPFWVDFDDSVIGPPVQDLWLVILGREEFHRDQFFRLVRSYEMMREFDWDSLKLIEPLRTLRMIHFSGWIAKRYQDPAFQKAFPEFAERNYWDHQINDLREQLMFMKSNPWR